MLVQKHLRADSKDFYNRKCKRFILPFSLAYLCIYSIVSLTSLGNTDPSRETSENFTHYSADCGLRMQLNKVDVRTKSFAGVPYFFFLHRTHAVSAISLFLVCIYQKRSVEEMAVTANEAGMTKQYRIELQKHRRFGKLGLLLVLAMDICGLLMGPFSSWENFTTFNFFFFAPWLFMVAGIYGCASSKLIQWHRYFGNMLLKGCIATPIARSAGSLLQQLNIYYGFSKSGDSQGYYYGIGAVTLVISLWQGKDTLDIWLDKYDKTPSLINKEKMQ